MDIDSLNPKPRPAIYLGNVSRGSIWGLHRIIRVISKVMVSHFACVKYSWQGKETAKPIIVSLLSNQGLVRSMLNCLVAFKSNITQQRKNPANVWFPLKHQSHTFAKLEAMTLQMPQMEPTFADIVLNPLHLRHWRGVRETKVISIHLVMVSRGSQCQTRFFPPL